MLKRICALLLAGLMLAPCLFGTFAEAEADSAPEAFAEAQADDAPEAGPTVEPDEGEGEEGPQPAKGYVLVTTATQQGWLPLPEEGEYSYPLTQVLPDGAEAVNVIHLTPEGVYMEDSTCANHDCLGQGTVTLDNRHERILGNMIICLPNQVTLQLFTPEEVLELVNGGS